MGDGKRKLAVVWKPRSPAVVRRRTTPPKTPRRSQVADEFGLDPEFRARALALLPAALREVLARRGPRRP